MSLVSIIMPYYKKINFIDKTYNSIIDQTYQNYELIILYDDTDLNEYRYLCELTNNNPKVKIYRNQKNVGAAQSRNIGISKSNGEYISFIDADDTWNENKLLEQINFMKKNNYLFSFSNYSKLYEDRSIKVYARKEVDYKDILNTCDIGLSTVMLKKNIVQKDLFPKIKTQEDFSAWLKITRENGIKAYNINKDLVTWNYDANSLSSNNFQKLKDAFKVLKHYEKFSILKSIFCLIKLSLNSFKRKF